MWAEVLCELRLRLVRFGNDEVVKNLSVVTEGIKSLSRNIKSDPQQVALYVRQADYE